MPTLPDKTALPQVTGGERPMALMPTGRDAVDAGAGLKAAGNAIAGLGGTIQAKIDEGDDYDAQKKIIDFDLAQEKRLRDAQHNAPPGGEGMTQAYREQYDNDARALMEQIPKRLRPKVDEVLVKKGAHYEDQAYKFELNERDRFHVDDVKGKVQELLNDTTANPDAHNNNRERGIALLQASKIPQRFKLKTIRDFQSDNEETAVRSILEKLKDPTAPVEELQKLRDAVRKAPEASWRKLGDNDQGTDAPKGTVDFIKREEGSKDNGWDVRQYSGPYGVKRGPNERLTLDEAEKRLNKEVAEVTTALDSKIKVPITPEQRTALTSLFYNIGTGKGRVDQVADMINNGALDRVPGWIKQYQRDADGKYLPGLAERRSREAALFAQGTRSGTKESAGGDVKIASADGTAPLGKVENGELPAAGETNDQGNVDGAPKKPIDENSDEPFPVAGDVPYQNLSVKARRTLGNVIGTALRARVERDANDDIERLRRGQKLEVDANGMTSIDRAARNMFGHQAKLIVDKAKAAQFEHETLAPIRELSDDEQQAWAARTWTRAEEGKVPLKEAAAIEKKQQSRINQNQKMRKTDPAAAVSGYPVEDEDGVKEQPLPNVKAALKSIKEARAADVVTGADGQRRPVGPAKQPMTPQQEWDTVFTARLADQATIMPDRPFDQKILTKIEAERLLQMPKNGEGMDDRTYRKKLEEATDRAEQTYGKKWAKKAIEDAIHFQLHGDSGDQKNIKARVIRKLSAGEDVKAELGQLNALSQIDRLGRPAAGIAPVVAPSDMSRPFLSNPGIGPTPDQEAILRKYPQSVGVFDQLFGPGAGARVLATDGEPKSKVNPGTPKDYKPKKPGFWN